MNSKKLGKVIAVIVTIAAICAVSSYIGYQYATESSKHYMAENISASEKNDMLNRLGTCLETIKLNNNMLTVQDGTDSYITTMHNESGEVLTQSTSTGYVTVYRKDNKAIRYTEYIDFGPDSNVISIIDSAYHLAVDGDAQIYGVPDVDKDPDYTQVVVDINGWDSIQKLYENIDPTLGNIMVEQLKSSLVSTDEDGNTVDMSSEELNFRFLVVIYNETNELNSAGCYIYLGTNHNIEWGDETLSTNWAIVGIQPVEKWSLSDDWYTLPFDDIENWEEGDGNADAANELLKDTLADLTDMVERVMQQLGGTEAEDTEGTDSNSTNDSETESESESESKSESGSSGDSSSESDVEGTDGVNDNIENNVDSDNTSDIDG